MKYTNNNLLNITEGIIVHGCNAQGIMGSGVAKQLRQKYPEIFTDYILAKPYYLGQVIISRVSPTLLVVSAITQQYYGRDPNTIYVDYQAVGNAFLSLNNMFPGQTLHIPQIGAGLGNGDWERIESIINAVNPNVICCIL